MTRLAATATIVVTTTTRGSSRSWLSRSSAPRANATSPRTDARLAAVAAIVDATPSSSISDLRLRHAQPQNTDRLVGGDAIIEIIEVHSPNAVVQTLVLSEKDHED